MSISTELDKLDELHRRGALSGRRILPREGAGCSATPRRPRAQRRRSARSTRCGAAATTAGSAASCGGLAQITGLAAWAWRVIFTLLFLCAGSGAVIYLLLWVFVPEQELQTTPPAPMHA
jgi:phage shock protein PspC (stress-responsive transcriptional regulator)